jgi:hypothetical protein
MITRNKPGSNLNRFITILFSLVVLVLLFNILFFSDSTAYAFKQIPLLPNWSLIFCAMLLIAGMAAIMQKIKIPEWTHRRLVFSLVAGSVILFIIQLVMIFHMYFYTGWDVRGIFKTVAAMLQHGLADNSDKYYPYSALSNNLNLTIVFYYIYKVCARLGMDGYIGCLILGALMVNLAGLFTSLCTLHITRKPGYSLLSWILFILLVEFSPWISIPYSDTYSIFFPIFVFYLYITKSSETKLDIRYFFIGLFSFIGAAIKPTVLIVLIAIALLEVWHLALNLSRKALVVKLFSFGLIAMAIIPVMSLTSYLRPHLSFLLDPNKKFGMYHYVMIGLNSETDGGYTESGVAFSESFPTVKERNQANVSAIQVKLNEYGLPGLINHLSRKAMVNFADGSFAWSIEGTFYVKIPEREGPLVDFLRNWFYQSGSNYSVFFTIVQLFWFMVLILCAANRLDRATSQTGSGLIFLTLLGLFAFVMLFEARARYLFNFSPYFLIGAVLGFDALVGFVTGKKLVTAKRSAKTPISI